MPIVLFLFQALCLFCSCCMFRCHSDIAGSPVTLSIVVRFVVYPVMHISNSGTYHCLCGKSFAVVMTWLSSLVYVVAGLMWLY